MEWNNTIFYGLCGVLLLWAITLHATEYHFENIQQNLDKAQNTLHKQIQYLTQLQQEKEKANEVVHAIDTQIAGLQAQTSYYFEKVHQQVKECIDRIEPIKQHWLDNRALCKGKFCKWRTIDRHSCADMALADIEQQLKEWGMKYTDERYVTLDLISAEQVKDLLVYVDVRIKFQAWIELGTVESFDISYNPFIDQADCLTPELKQKFMRQWRLALYEAPLFGYAAEYTDSGIKSITTAFGEFAQMHGFDVISEKNALSAELQAHKKYELK